MVGPVWMINATEYGHMDSVDEDANWDNIVDYFHVCPSNPNTTDSYRIYMAGQFVAFMDGRHVIITKLKKEISIYHFSNLWGRLLHA